MGVRTGMAAADAAPAITKKAIAKARMVSPPT